VKISKDMKIFCIRGQVIQAQLYKKRPRWKRYTR